jgi:hypothetical protein
MRNVRTPSLEAVQRQPWAIASDVKADDLNSPEPSNVNPQPLLGDVQQED